jgi:peptidoglycan-N-acetylglucosamine deacetylase
MRTLVRALLAAALALLSVGSAHAQVSVNDQRVQEHTPASDIDFAWPRIGVGRDDAMLETWARSLLDDFRTSLAARTAQENPYSAHLSYSVTRNDETAVVVVFLYSFYTGGAHPNSTQTTFNFLMPDGVRVFLPDLVGDAGIQRISDRAIADLDVQLGSDGYSDPNWIREGAGPYADNFNSFEWQPSELVLHFDPYAVAAYARGPSEVHIPLATLQDVLRPDPRAPLPSFDCTNATTDVETAICSDQMLAQLDRRVAEAYAMRLRLEAISSQPPTVQAQQISWLAQRDAGCAGTQSAALVSCLDDQYMHRLADLQRFA